MSKKKKIIILSCMIALLAVTAVLNFVLTGTKETTVPTSTTSGYFTEYRTERMTTRTETLSELDSIISASEPGSAEMSSALNTKLQLTKITENELLAESLIKAMGYEEAVVTIGLNSDNVNVIVKTDELSQDDAIKIYTVINDELNISPENVKIIPIV